MAKSFAIFINYPSKVYFYFIFLSLSTFQISNCQLDYGEEKPCGVLYSEPSAQGLQFAFGDQDQSVNLAEDQKASETGWNSTGSIVVEDGCKLKVCNETYFDGACHTLNHGSHTVSENDFFKANNISSVQCACAKQCKCSDIHIKKSKCGRAYLEGGCKTCHALYADLSLNINQSKIFAEDMMEKVEAIRLRKGCTLTLFSDLEFEGEETIIDAEITEDFVGEIGSYKCDCDDSLYVPKPKPPRPESYPALIDIPASMDDVIKMLSTDEYRSHPGLHAARKSYRNERSSKNAYILLIGSTGAGKSSAINLLFDNPSVTKVGDVTSTTSNIHEFRIPVPIDELGIANSELRVIDTPGLGDTRGLEQDAKFLATLESFLASHEELKDRIPNVVLVFHKFNDNRFGGQGSSFVKMIRGLDVFTKRITDEKYSNVIFVLSHFCSITKSARRRPESRIKSFKDVIEDYSLYPKPIQIVVAENKAMDQELPMVNGYFKLPNNEYYPRNLFEKLELVTEKGGDTVGLGVFRTAFRDSENFNVSSSTFNLVSTKTGSVEKYLSVLTNANIGVVKTAVSEHLQQTWEHTIKPDLRKKFPYSLAYLQKALNLRNINTMQDVPRTTPDILSLLTALKQDEATITLLEKGLSIKSPDFPLNTVAGYSYNVFKDAPLPSSPFKLGDVQSSEIGFMIPKSLTSKLDPDTKEHFIVFDNKEKYLQHRLQSLGIDGSIPVDQFTSETKPGLNIKDISFREDGCSITAAKDFRRFEFILNDKLDFTQEFENTVRALTPYNESDVENVDQWKRFFDTYGTHVVKSIHGGGSVQVKLESNQPFNDKFRETIFDLLKFAEDLEFDLDDDVGSATNETVLREGISQRMTFIGGNPDYHTGDLSKMTATEASKLMNNWKKSLKFYPAILATEMRLVPISQLVLKKIGQNYTEQIEAATSLQFKSELKYKPPPPKKSHGPGLDRDSTPIVTEMLKMIQESNDRFHNMTLEMKKAEQANEAKRLELEKERIEWQKNQTIIDDNYRRDRDAAERKATKDRDDFQKQQEDARRAHDVKMAQINKDLEAQRDKAKAEADRRQKELIDSLKPKPTQSSGGGGGCLKAGTKILMADLTEKSVEKIKHGDLILDKDFKPTKVLGIVEEFVLDQQYFGFEQNSYFFTGNHLFVGPEANNEKSKLYATSAFQLYLTNPLMAYLNITEFGGIDKPDLLYQIEKSMDKVTMEARQIQEVYQDPVDPAADSLMYDIQVDSPTGTYIANGYVCRHEIPPVEYWPNTMAIMFRLMATPIFEKLPLLEYTVENALKLKKMTEEIAEMVDDYLATRFIIFMAERYKYNEMSNGLELMKLGDIDIEECISKIFSSSVVSTAGVNLYAKAGMVIARYLDNDKGEIILTDNQVAIMQHELFDFIQFELEQRLKHL